MQEGELLGREDFHRERFSLDPDILDNQRQGPDQALEQNTALGSAEGPFLCWNMQNAAERRQQYFLIPSALVTAQNPTELCSHESL